ncbi:MAG: DUF1987 domain-containing protein [Bacteroidetes bacterium]|nr:DUF1987 domain-containing protein [Bacteroidota bacterium]
MKRLEILPSNNTPHILFDVDLNIFLIEGKSFPEDSKDFYRPVIVWVEEFNATNPKEFKICFNLFYLSSSSIISVKQFLMKTVSLNNAGTKVTVEWCYDEDDEDIKKTGEDYQKLTNLNFLFKINE